MLVTAAATFIVLRTLEVIVGAFLFGLFIVPSILIYYVLDFFHKTQKVKTIGYILPIAGWIIFLVVCIILDAQRPSSEGASEMAKAIMISDFTAGTVVYILMYKVKWLK
jgi:hypothetical protein